ncbi:hypothetical protein ACEWY4_026179 [Coilia grayii]|uniref:SUN domain-containing protein n=1 Tax=Coilia grayii TaxID=363190 RepID=A0ABD1IU33_9TELE
MSRRSMRLLTSGYYRTDGEIYDSSSSHEVSYRETPVRVFRRRTVPLSREGSQRTTPSLSRAATAPCLSFSSLSTSGYSSSSSEECEAGLDPTWRKRSRLLSRSQSQGTSSSRMFSGDAEIAKTSLTRGKHHIITTLHDNTHHSNTLHDNTHHSNTLHHNTHHSNTLHGITAAYHDHQSTKHQSHCPSTNCVSLCPCVCVCVCVCVSVLFAGLFLLCCSIFGLLRDVLLLGSRILNLRKPALTVLTLTLLATGFWYWYPALAPAWSGSSVSTFGMNTDPRVVTDFNVYHQEVLDHINQRDAIWKESWTRELHDVKKEINLLKKDGERHRHMSELLQMDMGNLKDVTKNNDPDWQTKMTEDVTVMAKNVAELKNSVSHLSNDHRNLNQRMEAQEDTNAQLKKELTDWITEELQRRVGMDTGSILLRPELQGALEALERRLLQRLSELEHKQHGDVWKIVGESLQTEGLGAITIRDVNEIVQRALSLYKADGTGMADYALESLGASVIESQSSETYSTRSTCTSLFGIPLWYISGSPRTVIQPEVHPGKCWPFRGSQGFVTVALSHPVRVTHVTLEHIPKSLSPTGRIDSAPREFAVYGLSGSGEQEEGHILGRFTYDSDGEPVQTFQLPDSVKDVYRAVQLRVLSNWGHPEYSCVYRFRVHGQPLPH